MDIPKCRYRIVSCLSFIAYQSIPPPPPKPLWNQCMRSQLKDTQHHFFLLPLSSLPISLLAKPIKASFYHQSIALQGSLSSSTFIKTFFVTKPSFVCLHWFQSFQKLYRDQIFWDKLKCIGSQIWWYRWALLGGCIWHLFSSTKHWWGAISR